MKDVSKTFLSTLVRSNSQIKFDRALRFAAAAERDATKLIYDLEAKRDNILEVLDASKDLSTSNDRNTLNVVEQFKSAEWIQRFHKNRVDLRLINEELEIAREMYDELFAGQSEAEKQLALIEKEESASTSKRKKSNK